MEIRDRIAVVTGAGSGIGRALARRFVADGARHVVCVDIGAEGVAETARQIGERASAEVLDVSDSAGTEALVARVERDIGPIDVFCANAGVGVAGDIGASDQEWDLCWRVNLLAHLHAARAMVPRMLERGEGYLINTASAAGLLTQPGSAPYTVTKHAAVGFAEYLAITYGDRGIRVSALCPQAVRTAMTAGNEDGPASVDGMMEPEQVAEAVVRAMGEERFLILPHEEVRTYMQRKASDHDRWIQGMQRFRRRYGL